MVFQERESEVRPQWKREAQQINQGKEDRWCYKYDSGTGNVPDHTTLY